MVFALLLTGLLVEPLPQSPSAAVQVPTQEQADALAQSGDRAGAMAACRALAAANPRNHRARICIGDIHLANGQAALAEPVYRSVMLEAPDHLEAMLGVASALTALGRSREALAILERAERTAPEDPRVLAALGRAHLDSGDGAQAVRSLQRAARAGAGGNARAALEQARVGHAHSVESRTFVEDVNDTTPTGLSSDLLVNVRVRDGFRLVGRGQYQRKFTVSDQRGGLGAMWQVGPKTMVGGHLLVGPGNLVLPRTDVNVEVNHSYQAADWAGTIRYIGFQGAHVTVTSPSVTWHLTDAVALSLRYDVAVTAGALRITRETSQSAAATLAYRVRPRVWAHVGYASGVENFDTLSPDQLGKFDADTLVAGARVDLASLTSIRGAYQYQSRPFGVHVQRVTVTLAQRF